MPKISYQPASNFTDAFNLLLKELKEKKLYDAYYVYREESPIDELKARLVMDASPLKILYSGHGKSGKTTELFRLIFELQDKYFIVFYSILQEMEISDIEYVDVLLFVAFKLWESALEKNLKIDKEIVSDFNDWLEQITSEVILTRVEEKTKRKELGAKLKYLIGEVGTIIRTDKTSRDEIRKRLSPRTSEVIERIDILIESITQQTNKSPLVIIDDLEKADLAIGEQLFFQHSQSLIRPSCKIVYTVPISLIYSGNFRQVETRFPQPVVLPMIRTKEEDGSIFQPGIDLLKRIIQQRVSEDLFESDALVHLVKSCNGVLSDLLSGAATCCVKAESRGKKKITWDIVDEVCEQFTRTYRRMLLEKYYPKLDEIYKTKRTKNDQDLRDLLHMLATIEYEQGEYYNVHPAIVPILKEKDLTKDAKSTKKRSPKT